MQQAVFDVWVIQQTSNVRGVPQVSVFGPLFFLEFMSYLPAAVSSQTRLFADDCILYRPIKHFSLIMTETLQNDLG